jgi:Fe(3+) dicitrate transport protein
MFGTTTYYSEKDLPNTIIHKFPLFGVSRQYKVNSNVNIYAGWSQVYRPVLFKDIIPGNIYETVNKDLKAEWKLYSLSYTITQLWTLSRNGGLVI